MAIRQMRNMIPYDVNELQSAVGHMTKTMLSTLTILYFNANIMEVQCIKYLGVILDNKLWWIQHISYVKSKISKDIGIMYIARNYIHKNALLGLYHSYIIYPYLIALNLGATHQIGPLILYLCYRNVFLETLPFLIIMLYLNYYLGILIFRPYVS